MSVDTRQFLIAMAKLDRAIAEYERSTYLSSYESQQLHELKDARTLLTSACVPGEYKCEADLDLINPV